MNPEEPIAVMMTRKRWSAMLDHLNAEIQPKLEAGTATPEEIDIVVHLACALVHAGMARAERAIVESLLRREGVPL